MYRKRYGAGRHQENGQERWQRHEQERDTSEEPASEGQEAEDAHHTVAGETPLEALTQQAVAGDRVADVPERIQDPDLGRLLRQRDHPAHDPEKGHPRDEGEGHGQEAPGRRGGDRTALLRCRGAQGPETGCEEGDEDAGAQHSSVLLHQHHERGDQDRPARSFLPQVEGQEKSQRGIAQLRMEAKDGVVEDGTCDRAQVPAQERHACGQVEACGERDPDDGGHVEEDEAQDEAVGAERDGEGGERQEQVEVVDGRVVTVDVVAEQLSRLVEAPAHLEKREEVGVVVLEVMEEKGLAQPPVEDHEHGHGGQDPRGDRRPCRQGTPIPERDGDAFRKASSTSA